MCVVETHRLTRRAHFPEEPVSHQPSRDNVPGRHSWDDDTTDAGPRRSDDDEQTDEQRHHAYGDRRRGGGAMSFADTAVGSGVAETGGPGDSEAGSASPFGSLPLTSRASAESATASEFGATGMLTPFSEALAQFDESELEGEAFDALLSELEDEDFTEGVQALADEAAARYLTSRETWGAQEEAPQLAVGETEEWMNTLAVRADLLLAELEGELGDRAIESVSSEELEAVLASPLSGERLSGVIDAQEQFLGALRKKIGGAVNAVKKVVGKGIAQLGKLLPIGRIIAMLRPIVSKLLREVLRRAIGKLPPTIRATAATVARRLGVRLPAAVTAAAGEVEQLDGAEALTDAFDREVAQLLMSSNGQETTELLAAFEQLPTSGSEDVAAAEQLDAARQRLTGQLAAADSEQSPVAELEEFIPAVMAAMPLLRMGVRLAGRGRIVSVIAKLMAPLMRGMVGPQAAALLSRHMAATGLGLLGLEAEADGAVGMEALVATVEDSVREVLSQNAESLDDDLLLEATVQEAFSDAALRHLPAELLRPELVETEGEDLAGVWVLMPRSTRHCYRYKKYSRVVPVTLARALARNVVLGEGETLEDQLLDAGVGRWPVNAEFDFYELLPGGEVGHLAAFEVNREAIRDGTAEFEEVTRQSPALPVAGPPRAKSSPPGRTAGGAGRRFYRVRVPGVSRRKQPRFALRVDLTTPQPELRLHLRIGERRAHHLSEHLQRRRPAQVLVLVRQLLGPPARQALARRLTTVLAKRGLQLPAGSPERLANQLAEGLVSGLSKQLPTVSTTLAAAAKDAASGVTITAKFPFKAKDAIGRDTPGTATIRIRPGFHRD
jgi:hypothetical protein